MKQIIFLLVLTTGLSCAGLAQQNNEPKGYWVIETRMGIPANSEIELGGKYRPGLYFVEVSHGQSRQTLKLLKR